MKKLSFYLLGLFLVVAIYSCKKETCYDSIQNQSETGVDCGGECNVCATCFDGFQNQNETGVDCGGVCTTCGTCNDGIENQNETGVDCGGVCSDCGSCSDGIQNQNEIGIDCGGVCSDCAPVNAPCTQSVNTSNFPIGMTDDSYSTSCSISNDNYQMHGYGSASDMTIYFNMSGPTGNKIYTTASSVSLSSLSDNQLVISTVAGGTFSYLYYAGSFQDVYVNVNGSTITAEFCSLTFNSPSYGAVTDLLVSGYLKCN